MEEESSSFHFIIRKALAILSYVVYTTSDRRLLRQGLLLFSSTLGRHLDMNTYFQEHYSQSYVPKYLSKECKKERNCLQLKYSNLGEANQFEEILLFISMFKLWIIDRWHPCKKNLKFHLNNKSSLYKSFSTTFHKTFSKILLRLHLSAKMIIFDYMDGWMMKASNRGNEWHV